MKIKRMGYYISKFPIVLICSLSIFSLLIFGTALIMGNDMVFAFLPNNTMNATNTQTTNLTQPIPIIVQTDKKTYGLGDFVEVSGTVQNMVEGKTLRLDVYMPDGFVLEDLNGTALSNIRLKPDSNGVYVYTFQLPVPYVNIADYAGDYRVSVTGLGNTVESKFTVTNSSRS